MHKSPFLNNQDFFKSNQLSDAGLLLKTEQVPENNLSKLKKILISILQKQLKKSFEIDFEEELLIKGKTYPVGTIREWQGKKFKKVRQGKWLRLYEKADDRGRNIAITKTIKKIENAKTINELAEIISMNKKRFLEGKKTSPVVKNLLDRARGRKESFEIKEEKKADTLHDILEKKGSWNGKIYGNDRYGYRVYIDNEEIKITDEQKNKLIKYKEKKEKISKEISEKRKIEEEFKYAEERAIEEVLEDIKDGKVDGNSIGQIFKESGSNLKNFDEIIQMSKLNNKKLEDNYVNIFEKAKEKYDKQTKIVQKFENSRSFSDKHNEEELIKMGGKKWEAQDKHRIYFSGWKLAEMSGLETEWGKKRGQVKGYTLNGEEISKNGANKFINSFDKFYYNMETQKFNWSNQGDEENNKKVSEIIKKRLNKKQKNLNRFRLLETED